jgi:hypothetical protein
VWAIGITMIEVITLHNPFERKNERQIEEALKAGDYPHLHKEDVSLLYDIELMEVVNKMVSV